MKSSHDATRNLTGIVFRYWDDDIKQMSPSPRFIPNQTPCGQTRREFLWQAGGGFAGLGLIDLFSHDQAFAGQLAAKPRHFPAKAKHMVFCS